MSFWQRRYPSRRSSPRAAYFPVVESEAPNRIGCSAGAGAAIPVTTATTASHRVSRDILMVQPPLRASLRARRVGSRFGPYQEQIVVYVDDRLLGNSEGGSAPLPNLPPRTGCAGKAGARTAFLTYAFSDSLLGNSEGGSAPLPNLPPRTGCAGKAGARTGTSTGRGISRAHLAFYSDRLLAWVMHGR